MYKSIVLAVSAIAGLAYAQNSIPTCAQSCVTIPAECGNGDPSCICNNASWITNISCCVFTNCDTADQQAALTYAQQICTPVGATLPQSASCASSTSASGSGSGSSTAASATGSAASSASAASSSVSSAHSSITSSASAAASSAASSASSAASSATATGAAAQIVMPGLLGAIVGAAALL